MTNTQPEQVLDVENLDEKSQDVVQSTDDKNSNRHTESGSQENLQETVKDEASEGKDPVLTDNKDNAQTSSGMSENQKKEAAEKFYSAIAAGERNPLGADRAFRNNPLEEIFKSPKIPGEFQTFTADPPQWDHAAKVFLNSRCIIIHSREPYLCRPFAYRLAGMAASLLYDVTAPDIGSVKNTEMVQRLCRDKNTKACLIIRWEDRGSDAAFRSILTDFAETISKAESHDEWNARNRYIVVCTHSLAVVDLINSGKWFSHITHLEIPYTGNRAEGSESVRTVMEGLSAEPAKGFAQMVAREIEEFIPVALVRLAVLFPNISTAHFERLLERVIGGRSLEVSPATIETKAKVISATSLWRTHKTTFEQQAGLCRSEDVNGMQILRFRSEETENLAMRWAWADPEAVFRTFASVSEMGLLFEDFLNAEEKEKSLFNAYLLAAVEVAKKAPQRLTVSWLETLERNYKNQAKGWKSVSRLQAHATNRVGALLNRLFLHGQPNLTEQFVESLFSRNQYERALEIILEISAAPDEKILKWLRRIMADGNQETRKAVIREIALEVSWTTGRAVSFLQEIINWNGSDNSAVRRAALAFPAVLTDTLEDKEFDSRADTSLLLRILESPSPSGGCIYDVCMMFASDPEFGHGFAEHLESHDLPLQEAPFFATALAAYQMTSGLPDSRRQLGLDFARANLRLMKLGDRSQVRQWWQFFSEQIVALKKRISMSTHPRKAQRIQDLERRYSIAKALIRG